MSQLYTPFRYDFVGSFLRPEYLKKARADYEAGAMSAEELKKTEDKAITELVAKQKEAGYHVITDGEFRRATCIWILCGHLTESDTAKPKRDFRSTVKLQ